MNDRFRIDIANFFIPSNEEKKKNAEISTPVNLVNEMLDKIPEGFWNTPKKVFEPCCGKGNFVLGIVDKFYNGLQQILPNQQERCYVILNQCLYYADISQNNIFITTQLIKFYLQYKLQSKLQKMNFNSYIGNTLELDIQDKFGIDGFDAVIGNPPYNSSGDTGTGNTIWQHFTKVSLNQLLQNNGYLLFVHPPGWRKPNTKRGKFYGLYKLMTQENQMIYLSINGIKDGQKTFKCGTRYDWYLIQKTPKYTTTIVNDEKNNRLIIDMNKFNWLPNYNIDLVCKLIANENEEKCHIIYSASSYEHRKNWMSKVKTQEFKYPCIHSTPKNGIRYLYSKVNDRGHFNVQKIIFGETGIYNSIIDIEGNYGLTNGCIGIKIYNLENGKKYKKFLESDIMTDIIKSCSFSSFRIDWNIFKDFKKDFWKEFFNETKINLNKLNLSINK